MSGAPHPFLEELIAFATPEATKPDLLEAKTEWFEKNGAVFVDVETAFTGHGIGSSSPWINAFSIFNTSAAFHPNSTGYANYATLVGPALG